MSRPRVLPCLFLAAAAAWAGPRAARRPAAEDPLASGRWPVRTYTDADGLPQNAVHDLAWDAGGRLWASTEEGLAVYDGHAWRNVTPPGLPPEAARMAGLLAASDGSLWAGTKGGLVLRFKDGAWTRYGDPGLRINAAWRFAELGSGPLAGVWAATDRGPWRFDGRAWIPMDPRHELPKDGQVDALAQLPDGRILAGGLSGLFLLQDGRWAPFPGAPAAAFVNLRVRGGALWACTRERGLGRWDGSSWTFYGAAEGLPQADVEDVAFDGAGRLWVLDYNAGLYRMEEGRFVPAATPATGLPTPQLTVLSVDPASGRRLWIGSMGRGLLRLDPGGWRAFGTDQGLPNPGSFALLQDHAGAWWAGTMDGLARFDAGRWRPVALPPAFRHAVVLGLAESDLPGAGGLWVGTNAGAARLKDGAWTAFTPSEGLPDGNVHALAAAGGALWAGTEGGLARFDGRRWIPEPLAGLRYQPFILGFARDGDTLYAAGYEDGLWSHGSEGGWTRVALPTRTTIAMSVQVLRRPGAAPELWVGTRDGALWRPLDAPAAAWARVGPGPGSALPDGVINGIQSDAAGRVYLFTNRGVARLTADPASPDGWRVLVQGWEDGLPSLEANTGSPMRDALGHLWIGTGEGIAVMDPAEDPGPPRALPLALRAEALDGMPLQAGARLAHRQRGLRFAFPLPSFFRESETRYRTQLVGLEDQPGPWTGDPVREFPSLPAGDYTFRVWATDYAGTASGPVDFRFSMAPAPWLSPWAFGAYGLLLMGGGLALGRWRARHLRRRAAELERAVEEKTHALREAELKLGEAHDHLLRLAQEGARPDESLETLARRMADEVSASLGIGSITIWEIRNQEPVLLSGSQELRPVLDGALTLDHLPHGSGDWTIPATGPSGDTCAALVLHAPPRELAPAERRLLTSLAQQVGGAVEMARLRKSLLEAEERHRLSHEALHAEGVDTLWTCPRCLRCYDQTVQACPEDGAALEAPRVLPYRIQGRYRMVRRLGEGGMGTIFLAQDERLQREVALKLISADRFQRPEARLRFEREARTVAKIQHPRVISIFDSGELEDGSAYIVMELLQGLDLAELLAAWGPGSPRQVAVLLRQVASALQAAHDAGIIHRDVKPANLFLSNAPEGSPEGAPPFFVKVLDFGLAKSMDLDRGLTQAGMVVGTPQYMSPEQLRGQAVDARTDLYSLATVAYEALTGHRPIPGDSAVELMSNILRKDPRPVSAFLGDAPPALDAAFTLALSKRPEERALSVEAWAALAVEALLELPAGAGGWPVPLARPEHRPDPFHDAGDLPTRKAPRQP